MVSHDTGHSVGQDKRTQFLLFGLLIALVLRYLLREFVSGLNAFANPWMQGDWLINYSGGFVRRGFAGSVIHVLRTNLDFDPLTVIAVIAVVSFVLVIGAYLRQVLRVLADVDSLNLALLLFLPTLILFPLLDPSALGRKEMLFVVALALHLRLVESLFRRRSNSGGLEDASAARRYAIGTAIIFTLFGIPVALTHESILFLALPLNMLIFIRVHSMLAGSRRHLGLLVVFGPSVIASVVAFAWRSEGVVNAICRSWGSMGVLTCYQDGRAGAIEALDWSIWDAMAYTRRLLSTWSSVGWWLLVICIALGMLLIATARRSGSLESIGDSADAARLSGVLYARYCLLPLAASIPVFVAGWDWGRWIWVVSISYAFVLTCPELVQIEAARVVAAPSRARAVWARHHRWVRFHRLLTLDRGLSGVVVFSTSLFVILFIWMPHCCRADVGVVTRGLWSLVRDL